MGNGVIYNPPHKVTECKPIRPQVVAYSTEVLLNNQLHIPDLKPDLETVIDVTHQIYITKISTIPVELSRCSKGCKFLIQGFIRLGIEYAALYPEQTVHLAHFTLPFESLITDQFNNPIPWPDCNWDKFRLYAHIEYVSTDIVDTRTIDNDIVLLIWLKGRNDNCQSTDDGNHFEKVTESPHNNCSCDKDILIKQLSISQRNSLPVNFPSMLEILDNSVTFEFKKVELIDTPLMVKPCSPLKKVLIKGIAEITVKYLTDRSCQDVHGFTFNLKICSLLEWPCGPSTNVPLCIEATNEFLEIKKLSSCNMFTILVLRFKIYQADV